VQFKHIKTSWLIITGCLLLLGSTAIWWFGEQKTVTAVTPHAAPTGKIIVAPVKTTQVEAEVEVGTEAVDTTTTSFASRLRTVPNTRDDVAPSTDIRDITAGNIENLLQANLDSALAGEISSAYFVTRARMACERFANSPEDLEQRIKRANRKVEKNIKRGRDLPSSARNGLPWSATSDTEANRARLEDWYDACQRMQSIFTPDLRQQLESQALNGDVMARYLYASWPLELLNAGEAFDQQFRWEGLARNFSQANLDRGEVAGLMAFSQSYQSGSFTERNGELALAFTIAALNCGFETTSSRNFLTRRIDQLSNSDDPADLQRLQFALAEADYLGRLCIK